MLEHVERIHRSFSDPWLWLTGYELGEKWTPGPGKGFVFTLDEHDPDNPVRQFPNKEYLWWATKKWLANRKTSVAKSRQIMISWLMISLHLWLCMTKRGALVFFQNKKETDAKEMLRRAKFIYHHLPEVMRKLKPLKLPESSVEMEFEKNLSRIKATPQGGDVLRLYTATAILSDENAFQEEAAASYAAAKPTIDGGGRYTMVSSPNGKEFFHRLWSDEGKRIETDSLMTGVDGRQNANGFYSMRIFYYADPDKNPKTEAGRAWCEEAKRGMPPEQWDREFEISFGTGGGHRIYNGFSRLVHAGRKPVYSKDRTLYITWDFGYHHPAVLWAQINDSGQLAFLREMQGTDETIYKFVPRVLDATREYFPDAKVAHFCDPAGAQKSDKSDKTTVDILRTEFHVNPRFQRIMITIGLDWIRKLLMVRDDGEPGILVDPDKCPILVEGFEGGYVSKTSDPDMPADDGYYEHTQDCARILVNNIHRKLGLTARNEPAVVERRKTHGRTVSNAFGQGNQYTAY